MNQMNLPSIGKLGIVGLVSAIAIQAIAQPTTVAQSIDLATLQNSALTKHNTYRAKHQAPALTANATLNSNAQSWAEYLAANGLFQHSSATQRNNAGENLYVFYTTFTSTPSSALADKAVNAWYNEVKLYNYSKPGFSSKTGHFTQLVWKSSTQLGCGAARGLKTINGIRFNAFYVVCHYTSPGNAQGQFPANVLPPK